MFNDTEKLIFDTLISGILSRIDTQWSVEKCTDLVSDDALSAFDKEIRTARDSLCDISARLEGALRDIKASFEHAISRASSCRNRLPPINRLPVEILRVIFQLVPPGGIFYNRNIFLMTVCTHWRSIVIGDAKMWTHVDVLWAGKAYAMRAVKRNPSLPLTLLGCYGPGVRQWVLKFTAANLSRVQRLELDIDAGDWLKYKACFDDAQAPILTHLRIRGDDVDHDCHPLLRVPAPALRSLELSNCRYPWNAGIHTNLTDLEINAPDADDRIWTYFPDGDVAAVIREFPRLEHLTIFVADQYAGGEIFVVAQTGMRNLRSLDLNLPEDHLVHLMKCMLLPPEMGTIQLTAAQCIAPGTVAALFDPACIPDTLLSRVVSLYLSTTDYGSTYTLQGFTDPHKKTEAILEVEIELFESESTLENTNQHPCALLLLAIREHYSLPKLVSVTFGGNRDVGGYAQLWSDFTREMGLFMVHNPALRHVTFNIETEYMYTMANLSTKSVLRFPKLSPPVANGLFRVSQAVLSSRTDRFTKLMNLVPRASSGS